MKYSLPTHPETSHQLLHRSFLLYRYSWTQVFYLTLLLSITLFLPNVFSLVAGADILANLPFFSIQKGWLLLLNLAGLIFFVAILWRLHCLVLNKPDSLEEDLKIGLLKTPSIIVASLIQSILISTILMGLTLFVYYVILGENVNMWDWTWKNYLARKG